MERASIHYTPDCVRPSNDGISGPLNVEPLITDEGFYLPTSQLSAGIVKSDNGSEFVIVLMSAGRAGLMSQMTPDGARAFARSVLHAADEAEKPVALLAATKLAQIRKDRR